MPEEDPERQVRRLLDFIDKPIRDRDAIELAEDMESEAMRAERDADFEVIDDVPENVDPGDDSFEPFDDVDRIDLAEDMDEVDDGL